MRDDLPKNLVLTPLSRWPTRLPADTVRWARDAARLAHASRPPADPPRAGPPVSVVIPTLNNSDLLVLCLTSLLANDDDRVAEIVVVDNGSTDATPDYLRRFGGWYPQVRPVFNDRNTGFAPAINQGVGLATAGILVLLNDDTVVPPGWLPALTHHLDDPGIGLVGPVTNRAGNEAQIDTTYHTYGDMVRCAATRVREYAGQLLDIPTATMFCAALRRDVWRRVGPLDERFEIGMFEDEDYAERVRATGLRVVCAQDSFVHHFGQASLGKLAASEEYGPLFHANRRRWEQKWQRPWRPHRQRRTARYDRMVHRLRALVDTHVPLDATVLIVSKGDDQLLDLPGRVAWHFPQARHGGYAGHHPADGAAAVAELERMWARGATHLVIPASALWWLQHYPALDAYLRRRCRLLTRDEDSGAVFATCDD